MTAAAPIALALHGGAGARRDRDHRRQLVQMRELIERGGERLAAGAASLDVVVEVVAALEASGLYVAGRGAPPNSQGRYELDASLMDGRTARAGAVAALRGFQSPISAARAVMDRTPHVMLAGDGAAAFADAQGLTRIIDETAWFIGDAAAASRDPGASPHGTVGCVALDRDGGLAAATSTGGVAQKLAGRVGDSPIIGAGTWADGEVAVSCTGHGEYFIRTAAAAQIGFRVRFAGQSLAAAAAAALAEVAALGGDGGLIAVNSSGAITLPFNTEAMARAALQADGQIIVEVL